MKKLIITFIITIIVTVAGDYAVGKANEMLFSHMPDGGYNLSNANEALNRCNADVLILGSSRAAHHYNSQIIQDSLHLATYNSGADGRNMFYQYAVLVRELKRHTPRIVILDVTAAQFDDTWIDRIDILYPYFFEDKAIRQMIEEVKGANAKYKMLSHAYRYNSTLPDLVRAYGFARPTNKGYTPLPSSGKKLEIGKPVTTNATSRFAFNPVCKKYLKSLFTLCREEGIRLYLFNSPMIGGDSAFSRSMAQLCKECNQYYSDLSSAPQYIEHTELFKDTSHLNKDGADEYTRQIVKLIAYAQ